MTHFVLVHGAWHGAWCWERFIPELEARGHAATSMDLPIDDASATFDDYAAVVLGACGDAEDVVLVGHSLGGMVLPLVAARRPVQAMAFVCAVVPKLGGQPWDDAPPMGAADYGNERLDDGTLVFTELAAARWAFYEDCSESDARWAFERLRPMRNQSLWDRPYPLDAWPSVRSVALACADDVAIYASYVDAACCERLGIGTRVLPGGHSPFLADPSRLADALLGELTRDPADSTPSGA